MLAYTALLGEIRNWIKSAGRLPPVSITRWSIFDGEGALRRGHWPSAALAYALVRHVWEYSDDLTVHSELRPPEFHFGRGCAPVDTLRTWEAPSSDLSVQAIVLAQFATFFWSIERLSRPSRGDFLPADRIISRFVYNTWPRVGNVTFPTIDGLPLGRFKNPQISVKDGLELLFLTNRYDRHTPNRV
ncbi:hypothetical protein [Paraburkholderia sp. ZP32-5]|uniref:hypothetical protein n=1 Tax=Paraburkholderia sp. ZP32-5 TaxID=2883245 RepID=UPI001F2D0B0A|nr:hypothetical protein [Paraburkholderia sp. ZP32-5]